MIAPRSAVSGRVTPGRLAKWGALAVIICLTLFPIYWMVTLSLKTGSEQFSAPPTWIPREFVTKSFQVAWLRDIGRYFLNSLVVSGCSAFLSVSIGILAAQALKTGFRGGTLFALALLVIRMIPPIVIAIPLFMVLRQVGLLDTYRGLIIVYTAFTLPYSIWLLRSFLVNLPDSLEDAGRVDGCSRIGVLVRVVVPCIAPGVAAAFLFAYLVAWNEFTLALVLTRTLRSQTLPIAMAGYVTEQSIQWGAMAATAVISMLPAVVLIGLMQRYYVRGLTMGAVKG